MENNDREKQALNALKEAIGKLGSLRQPHSSKNTVNKRKRKPENYEHDSDYQEQESDTVNAQKLESECPFCYRSFDHDAIDFHIKRKHPESTNSDIDKKKEAHLIEQFKRSRDYLNGICPNCGESVKCWNTRDKKKYFTPVYVRKHLTNCKQTKINNENNENEQDYETPFPWIKRIKSTREIYYCNKCHGKVPAEYKYEPDCKNHREAVYIKKMRTDVLTIKAPNPNDKLYQSIDFDDLQTNKKFPIL